MKQKFKQVKQIYFLVIAILILSTKTFAQGEMAIYKGSKTAQTVDSIIENIVEVTIRNSGEMDGDEIVQLYISHKKASVIREVKSLKEFE